MGQKLSPDDMKLYRRTDEVLHYLWDPIGISDIPEARDEYHSYLPHVFSLLKQSKDQQDIVDYLIFIEGDRMGMGYSKKSKKRALEIVEILINYKGWIEENSEQ